MDSRDDELVEHRGAGVGAGCVLGLVAIQTAQIAYFIAVGLPARYYILLVLGVAFWVLLIGYCIRQTRRMA